LALTVLCVPYSLDAGLGAISYRARNWAAFPGE
jgi:hypothetical protein